MRQISALLNIWYQDQNKQKRTHTHKINGQSYTLLAHGSSLPPSASTLYTNSLSTQPLTCSIGKTNHGTNFKNEAKYWNKIDLPSHSWQKNPNSNLSSLPPEQAIIRCRKAMALKRHTNPNISTLKKENCQDVGIMPSYPSYLQQ